MAKKLYNYNDRRLDEELNNLYTKLWVGELIDGGKAGNFQGVWVRIEIKRTNEIYSFRHKLGRKPLMVIPVLGKSDTLLPLTIISLDENSIKVSSTATGSMWLMVL